MTNLENYGSVKSYSKDIEIKFELGKCAKATFKWGKLKALSCIILDIDITIKVLDKKRPVNI